MKKSLLSLLIISLISFTVFSQNLQILDHNGNDLSNTTYDKTGINTETVISIEFDIKNNSTSAIDIKIKKYEIDVTAGHDNFFCLGSCFPPSVFESPNSVTIDAGATLPGESGFSCDVEPNGIGGITTMAYTIFDANNENDSVHIIINFKIEPYSNSIFDLTGEFISKAYPNPATDFVSFDYNFNSNAKAGIKIHNMLGSEVMFIELTNSNNSITVPVGSLMEGVYFWSFIVDNKIIKTERLVIN